MMCDVENLEIIECGQQIWGRFQAHLDDGPCCNFSFPGGRGFGVTMDGTADGVVSFVWYTYAYRNNHQRRLGIPEYHAASRSDEIKFLNENVRLLARVSTLPDFRRKGLARRLVGSTLCRLDVEYVECLTVWPDVRCLLSDTGFELIFRSSYGDPDYWLWCRGRIRAAV